MSCIRLRRVPVPRAERALRIARTDGLGDRFTVQQFKPTATTNAIESLLSRTRHVKRTVKRWRGGTMVLRWVAAGVLEAKKGFRGVKGCQDMLPLVAAFRAGRAAGSRGIVRDGRVFVRRSAAEFQQRTGHPPPLSLEQIPPTAILGFRPI